MTILKIDFELTTVNTELFPESISVISMPDLLLFEGWYNILFYISQIKMTDRKAVIKNADMSEDMQQDAVDCATQVSSKISKFFVVAKCE